MKAVLRGGRYSMSVYPEVRAYADPFDGLTVQLGELRGLIKIARLASARRRLGESAGSCA